MMSMPVPAASGTTMVMVFDGKSCASARGARNATSTQHSTASNRGMWSPVRDRHPLRADFSSKSQPARSYWRMIFSENRYPLFGIMRGESVSVAARGVDPVVERQATLEALDLLGDARGEDLRRNI